MRSCGRREREDFQFSLAWASVTVADATGVLPRILWFVSRALHQPAARHSVRRPFLGFSLNLQRTAPHKKRESTKTTLNPTRLIGVTLKIGAFSSSNKVLQGLAKLSATGDVAACG